MFTYKTDAQLEAMTAAERDTYASEKRAYEGKIAKEATDLAVSEAIKVAKEDFKADLKVVSDNLEKAQKANADLEEVVLKQGEKLNEKQVLNLFTSKEERISEELKNHKEGLEASTKKGRDYTFEIKADTLRSSVVGNPNALDLTDIGQLAHKRLTVYDVFRKVPVPAGSNGVVRYVDWDDATKVRAAAAVAEGAAFPESTAKWATYTLALQKVGDIIPCSEELMYDAPLFAAELANFLETNVSIKVDNDLVNGNGTAPNLSGLKVQIPNYTPVAAGIVDASIYDLLVKTRETITGPYGSKYSPNVAFMNIADISKMKLKKDANNNYILPPFYDKAGNVVDGVTVLECNAFAANTMVIGDSRYGAIYEIPGVVVETGYATGDFESDMMSIKARKRLNLLIRTVDQTGWLEVTSISAALTTLAS